MKAGLACERGVAPAPELVHLLGAAGLPVEVLASMTPPAVTARGDDAWLLAPGPDVVAACRRGVIDVAVVGKDLLLELDADVYELLDLGIGADRLVYASPPAADDADAPRPPAGTAAPPAAASAVAAARPRVATPYPEVARRYFAAAGTQAEAAPFASAGLAPRLGLAAGVVDLESRLPAGPPPLVVRAVIASCSLRLVAGRAARALRGDTLAELVERLRAALEGT